MSSDTKILVSYLFIMTLLVPNVISILNFIKKKIKHLNGDDDFEK